MRKIKLGALILILILIALIAKPVSAYNHAQVLGVSSSQNLPQMQATTEGPGLVLPDSPLFFLDQIKQTTRVLLAFTSEEKAKVYEDIAGERFAELRFMLAKNNRESARIALQGVSDNFQNSARELSQAKFAGRNVTKLAKKINDDIKLKQQALDLLEDQVGTELRAEIIASSEVIVMAKVKVEENLPVEDLRNEIVYDLNRQITRKVAMTSNSASEIYSALDGLNKQATQAAQSALKRREEALTKAIAEKSESLRKKEEKLLELEKKKQESLLVVQKDEIERVKELVKKTEEIGLKLQQTQQTTEQIKSQLTLPFASQVAGEKTE